MWKELLVVMNPPHTQLSFMELYIEFSSLLTLAHNFTINLNITLNTLLVLFVDAAAGCLEQQQQQKL